MERRDQSADKLFHALPNYSETWLKRPLKDRQNKGLKLKTSGSFVQVKSIVECGHSAILLTCIKRLLVLKTYFGSFFVTP